jgi:uncharacterized protein (TIGR02270 family)
MTPFVLSSAELHLDEAEYLVEAFELDLDADHSTLSEVTAGPEERLLAHLDGLVAVGEASRPLLNRAVAAGTPARRQAAAMAFLAPAFEGGLKTVISELESASETCQQALVRALSLSEDVEDVQVVARLGEASPPLAALLLEVLARRAVNPGELLERLLFDATTRVPALRAARYAEGRISERTTRAALESTDEAEVHAGLLLAAQHSIPFTLEHSRSCLRASPPLRRLSFELLALIGEPADLALLRGLASSEELLGDVVWALGFQGGREAMEVALQHLEHPRWGGVAAEAFVASTGLDAAREGCRGPRPAEPPSLPPLEEDDLDADLVPKVEAQLPRLDLAAVKKWWARNQNRFTSGQRYLGGAPLAAHGVLEALATVSMRRRHVLALELAARSKGKLLIPTRAATVRQRRFLGPANQGRLSQS